MFFLSVITGWVKKRGTLHLTIYANY